MGCVHGRPSTSSPAAANASRRRDHPPPPAEAQKQGADASAEADAAAGEKGEQPAVAVAAAGPPVKRERRSRSSRSAHAHAHAEVRIGGSFANKARGEQVAAGWPAWLSAVAGDAIDGWTPRRADSFEKIDKVKCYVHQLLSGLEHCHDRGVLHRDIKGSNLLLDNNGVLKIGDFGLASFFDPNHKQPMTSRVVTLWYRPPELLLGATDYGVGVDLWSAGCILAELLAGKPIMPGRTEVEQLHKIFKLCGSPTEEYWKKSKLPHATIFKPQQPYKRRIADTFKDFPQSALRLIETLLAIDPADRLTATSALESEFFKTEPHACDPSSLPQYPPSKEMDAKRRDEEARRLRAAGGRVNGEGARKTRTRERPRAVPAPEANAELQANIDKRRLITHANAKSKSEKFPPPHQDGALGYPLGCSNHMEPAFEPPDPSSFSTVFPYEKGSVPTWSGPLADPSSGNQKRKHKSGRSSKQPATARAR
ncbi:hypothetical protein OsI_27258 [Oryza sativa Indica Group]|uniref:[RNA-polymerase]-subunit kinase n=1 Tax=Oryza sativa subsp. indica TaxID=39946 RepID=A2YPQ7_ORYSI|nr:hypothetical protein OsI_27258 [Oryza sativa Indica Group]